jgi:hypothetical protein
MEGFIVDEMFKGTQSKKRKPFTRKSNHNGLLEDNDKYLRMILAIMKDIELIINTAVNRQKLYSTICMKLIENRHYRYVWIGLYSDRRLSREVAIAQTTLDPLQKKRYRDDINKTFKNQHIYYDDLHLSEGGAPIRKKKNSGLGFSLMIPIKEPGEQSKPLGMIAIYSNREHGFVQKELDMLTELADSIGTAIKYDEMEQQMLVTDHKSTADNMIGNIAHKWRQPINELGLILQDLNDAYYNNELDGAYLKKSTKDGMEILNYMSETIDTFRNFLPGERQKNAFQLIDVVNESLAVVGDYLKTLNIDIEVTEQHSARITGYYGEMSQLLVGILNHSREAILRNQPDKPIIQIRIFEEDGNAVLTVENNGGQFIEDLYGTSWGLYSSKSIIENGMNGKVILSKTMGGTRFRVEVPV